MDLRLATYITINRARHKYATVTSQSTDTTDYVEKQTQFHYHHKFWRAFDYVKALQKNLGDKTIDDASQKLRQLSKIVEHTA